jgi:hypothetical protein
MRFCLVSLGLIASIALLSVIAPLQLNAESIAWAQHSSMADSRDDEFCFNGV